MRDRTVEQLFTGEDVRYRVPIYQRHYVWNDIHWDHLWKDMKEKGVSVQKGSKILESKGLAVTEADRPLPHFTGVIVTRTNQDGEIVIVDGQQRLTTFQIILCVIQDICKERFPNNSDGMKDEKKILEAVEKLVKNPPHPFHEDQPEKQYKLLPTDGPDREAYKNLVFGNTCDEGLLTEAYKWFKVEIERYISNYGEEDYSYDKMYALSRALLFHFKIVVMPLDEAPYKAAKVFESLNGRGLTLTQFDLLRNNVFLRAGEDRNRLYEDCWREFNIDKLWLSEEVVDDFLQTFLEAKLKKYNHNRSLFDLYQRDYLVDLRKELGVESGNEDEQSLVELEFEELQKYSRIYADISNCRPESPMWFFEFIKREKLQITSWHPLILFINAEFELSDENERKIFCILESYIVRYLLCFRDIQKWELTKNFRELRQRLVSLIRSKNAPSEIVNNVLKTLKSERNNWPDDVQISQAIKVVGSHWSKTLITYILLRIECESTEPEFTNSQLGKLLDDDRDDVATLEHVMPRGWENAGNENNGEKWWSIAAAGEGYHEKARLRDQLIHSIGNLTILDRESNQKSANNKFGVKKEIYKKYAESSRLSLANDIINDDYGNEREEWDVDDILVREEKLINLFCKVWPSPENCEG